MSRLTYVVLPVRLWIATSNRTNVGSAPLPRPASSISDSQPNDACPGPSDAQSAPDHEPIANPVGSPSPVVESVGVSPVTHRSAASHPKSSASPSNRSAVTLPSSALAHITQTSSTTRLNTATQTTLVYSTTSVQFAQPHLSSSSSASTPYPLITRVPYAASKSPKNEAMIIAPLTVVAFFLILAALFFFHRHRKLLLEDTEKGPESIRGSRRESLPTSTPTPLPNLYTPKQSEFLMSNSLRPKSRISLSTIRTAVPSVWERRRQWVITNRTPTPSPVTPVKEESFQ